MPDNDKLVPITPVSLLSYKDNLLPTTNPNFSREQSFDKDTSPEMKEDIGNVIFSSTDTDRKRADSQSALDQTGNTLGRIVTDFLGGTIQGVGATAELPNLIYEKIKGDDSDFNNGLMELGRGIEEWGKDKLPLYHQNPGKSWDVTDPAWWFEGIESAASSLQFLIPVEGAVAGFGGLAKLAKAEEFLGGLGANVEKIKYFSKIGVGSIVARNAENMMESYQVRQSVKGDLLNEWESNPKAFEELRNGEAAKELEAKGKEVNKENLANYIAGQAGWKDYYVNSANIMFDALQLAPLFKGFDPSTRKGFFNTSTAVKEAQEAVVKSGVKYGLASKIGDYLNPTISGVGRSLSEGVEEMVNDLGSEEGKNEAARLSGKNTEGFGKRLEKFLSTGSSYESAFWGTMGGALFEGAGHLKSKAFDLSKGQKGNTDSDYRILEITNRADIIKEGSEKISEIINNKSINDDDKKESIARIKSDLALDLGLRAAQVGNTGMLLEQVKSPEFRKNLIDSGIATKEDVDKAIVNTTNDIKTAEELYKKHYNSFYTSDINNQVKNMLINESVTADFLIQKSKEKSNKLNTEIVDLKNQDSYMQSTSEENVETGIHTKALELAKQSLESYLDNVKLSKEDILSERGRKELEKINLKIQQNKELMADKVPSLEGLNPNIISKQSETILLDGINSLNNQRIAEYRKKETGEKLTKEFEESKKKSYKDSIDSFKSNLDTEIKEGKHNLETLSQLKRENKNNKEKSNYINNKIQEIKTNDDKISRNEEVNKARDLNVDSKPVNNPAFEQDEYSHIPQFKISDIDESTVNPAYKNIIDNLAESNNLDELQGIVGDASMTTNPKETLYARNKFQQIRDKLKASKEIIELNSSVETGITEFEIDEELQANNDNDNITLGNLTGEEELQEVSDNDTRNRLDFFKKIQNEPSIRAYIPAFSTFTKGYNSNHYFNTSKGNIIINNDFKDTFKTLFGKELQSGSEIEVQVDTKNPLYNKDKDSLDNVPIKFSYKGVTLGYLTTIRALEYNIKDLKGTTKGNELSLELPNVKAIRENFRSSEPEGVAHNSEIYKTKIVYKGNGTVISRGKNSKTARRSVEGIIKDFYTLEPGATLDTRTVYNATDKSDFFSSTKELKQGTIYGMIESANGTKIPVPLFVSKVDGISAANLQTSIDNLITLLDQGKTTESQEVRNLKDEIAKYIKVDKASQYDKPIGFRIYPKGTNQKGETTDARIVMTYYNLKGIKNTAVIKKNDLGFSSFSLVRKDENGKDEWLRNDDGTIYSQDVLDPDFSDILKLKYFNINLDQLKAKSEFNINGKTYKSYKDFLVDEEIIQTDIAQVLDTNGKVLSNLFGFNNDFSLDISSNLYKEQPKTNVVKELENVLMTSSYDKEYKSNIELDTTKYTVFSKPSVTASTVLNEILKDPKNKNIENVAKWLKSNINKTSIAIYASELEDKEIVAKYNTSQNSIVYNKARKVSEAIFQQTILHELIHGVTLNTLFNNVTLVDNGEDFINDISQVQFAKYCPSYVKDFTKDMLLIKKDIEDKLTIRYGLSKDSLMSKDLDRFYGLENLQEFISEVMVNPNFREEIRKVSDNGFFTRIYNKLVELLNKVFGLKLRAKENDTIKEAVDKIKNFVESTESIPKSNIDVVYNKKLQDRFNNDFSREEINEIINTSEGVILNIIKAKKLDIQENFNSSERNLYDSYSEVIDNFNKEFCPDSCKAKVDKVIYHKETFFVESLKRLSKDFKVASAYDIENIEDFQEVSKEWNDKIAQTVSSQDTITNQIKMFVRMTPELASLDTVYKEDSTTIWDTKKSTSTGMPKYVDFNVIYPYMVRNLIGSRTPFEVMERLNKMSKVYPSFAYMADALTRDSNLLAQIESNMGKKYSYDSYVTFLSAYDEGLTVRISDEAKDTRLADQWVNNINKIIDSLDTDTKKKDFLNKIAKQYMSILQLRDGFENNIDKISNLTFDLANDLGVNLSISAIEAQLKAARNWNDFKILKVLDNIAGDIKTGKKNNSFGNLNYLASIESIFTFDIIENSVLSIDGKPLYTIRNPHFVSNWFSLAKSETSEGKQEFETLLRNYASTPDMQLSNWLWNSKDKEGFLNYKVINNEKIVDNINWDFVNKFSFHNFGGAKETISKVSQQYTDFSEKDWMMINLLNHIQGSKKKGFIQVPGLIPSDSGSMYTLEVPKIELKSGELTNKNLSRNSNLYKAISNTVRQEIRRIQQATSQVFDIIDNKLVPKTDLDLNSLQQYFHYGKQFEYNEDGSVNLEKTLLDDKGKPKGKAFAFQNLTLKQGSKVETLNDINDIFINNHLEVGEVSPNVIMKINTFTDAFITQQINRAIANYQFIESNVAGKHDSIGNGSFEDLIAEYTLNQYIANVEQSNLFNGAIAEYKDKIDTNKRAKQMFAPGLALSIESMKIKLQNGSFTDGRVFRGLTIKDINTTSHTIDFIINSVKDKIILEKSYDNSDIRSFNLNNIKTNKSKTRLEEDVYDITKGYLKINAGDAQGYITLDRYESILRGLGRWNNEFQKTFDSIRKGEQVTSSELKTLQPLKGFYYGREFDSSLNRFSSNQIKYSTIPLIPQLVKGSEMEKLMDHMNDNGIDEAFFESAHKVGAKRIYNIHNSDGTINTKALKESDPTIYLNKNWQLQLDVPEHLVDSENLLATQIAKLVIANIDNSTSYNVNGNSFSGKELKNHYFNILNDNIIESANDLLTELGAVKTNSEFMVDNKNIQQVLIQEIDKRGLSENYRDAIELNERDEFNLPLSFNSMSYKWEAILTSLFTNRVTNQKIPGASAVLASRLFLDNNISQSKYSEGLKNALSLTERLKDLFKDKTTVLFRSTNPETFYIDLVKTSDERYFFFSEMQSPEEISKERFAKEIEFTKGEVATTEEKNKFINSYLEIADLDQISENPLLSKEDKEKFTNELLKKYKNTGIEWSSSKVDHTLKSYREDNGIQVVEVLLGAWSSNLYKDGQRISIDSIPDEIKTMIGYRIPTEKKSSMFVFKVVGFLPEESKGTIITPDDLINQSGWDFDVDKVFTMNKSFYVTDEGKFVVPSIHNEKEEFNNLIKEREILISDTAKFQDTDTKLGLTSDQFQEEIRKREAKINKRLGEIGETVEGTFQPVNSPSRLARNNEIFDIYHSILTNKAHLKETFTPSGFDDLINVADEINSIFGEGDNNINPLTEEGQRIFRKRNISGRALKGIAANFNSFGAVAQHSKMYLSNELAFKFKFDLNDSKYNKKELSERYKDDVQFKDNFAIISFKNLGFAPDNSFLNVEGDLILEVGSQGIAAAVDIVKNPTFDTLNATTYTYPSFHSMVLAGIPVRLAAMFTRQPIIKKLNDFYFDNKSLLGDNTGNQIEVIKRFYQTHLYNSLVALDSKNKNSKLQRTISRRKDSKVSIDTLDKKFLVYVKREETKEILKYNPDELEVFDVDTLKNQLEIASKGLTKLSHEDRVKFYTNQLMVLEYFNKYKKAGEGVQDVLQVSKTDGLGAGPTLMVTNELVNKIEKLRYDERVLIDEAPAISKIYSDDSVYSPLQTYYEYSNQLSLDVLKSLFIQQSPSFENVRNNIKDLINRNLQDEDVKNINKFLGNSLLQDFNRFKTLNKESILGINKEVNNDSNISYKDFKSLSTANKVSILQQRNSSYLKDNSQHILNFLATELDKEQIAKNGYHKLNIVFYKNELTDDNLADSILKMYESGNEFEVDLAEDLINYSFVSNGIVFGLNSYAKVIPSKLLSSWGIGDYWYNAEQSAKRNELFTDNKASDLFFRNNWNNSNIVPTVKTRWHYNVNPDTKRKEIVLDENDQPSTLNDSPNWESNDGILSISQKRFKTLSMVIRDSPYVSVYNKEGNKLYKKFVSNDNGVLYYQINKLGKDGINEFDTTSMFKENNSPIEEDKLIEKLEAIMGGLHINRVSENLQIENVDDSDLEDKINECKY